MEATQVTAERAWADDSQKFKRYLKHPVDIPRNLLRWKRSRPTDLPVVFVLGAPRSGTTLLHRILLNHSKLKGFSFETDIISPKSVHDFTRYEGLFDRELFDDALAATSGISDLFAYLHRHGLGPLGEDGTVFYVEKTPQHVKRIDFILANFPNALIVNMVRDGRDAFCSGQNARNIPQAADLARYAGYWRECVARRLAHAGDPRILDVRYEDFTADAATGLAGVMAHLGLEVETENQLGAGSLSQDTRSSEYAFKRLNEPISTKTVERWRTELSAEQNRLFVEVAGSELARMGYDVA